PASVWHGEVEHDHVRLEPLRLDNGFVAVRCLADDVQAEAVADDHADQLAYQRGVVTDQHAGGRDAVRFSAHSAVAASWMTSCSGIPCSTSSSSVLLTIPRVLSRASTSASRASSRWSRSRARR